MSERDKSKRRWPRLQFSMSTIMMLTLIIAMGVHIYLNYVAPFRGMTERKMSDGFMIHFQVTLHEDGTNRPDDEFLNGRYFATDQYGRHFCKGWFSNNVPVGRWSVHHPSGRERLVGQCVEGQRVGTWMAWHSNGGRAVEVDHGPPVENWVMPQEFYHHGMTSQLFNSEMAPIRDGDARSWWDNGQLRAEGKFVNDLRDGTWTFYDRSGNITATGKFRRGARHGRWQLADDKGSLKAVHYVEGRVINDVAKLIGSINDHVQSTDPYKVENGFERLGRIGKPAVPLLLENLKLSSRNHRLQALEQLAAIGPDAMDGLSMLKKMTRHKDALTRAKAMGAIFEIDQRQQDAMFNQLVAQVKTTRGQVRRQTIDQLAKLGSRILDRLNQQLAGEDAVDQLIALTVIKSMYELNIGDHEFNLKIISFVRQANATSEDEFSQLAGELLKKLIQSEHDRRLTIRDDFF